MLAVLNVERDPLVLDSVLDVEGLRTWVQDVGTFAAIGLFIWAIAWAFHRKSAGGGGSERRLPKLANLDVLYVTLLEEA